ncbi:hypothetical protein HII31_07748 [Pseudocercospora fuligena]|uniref:Uncharacterized protein n=1 Tax=Pseudocercospora fuligena TaxID=685502 RepID=A0A8H6VJT3_9PEZI|nr:hypothetical protein HII31_07748 [Pseudocercospora fuligena]
MSTNEEKIMQDLYASIATVDQEVKDLEQELASKSFDPSIPHEEIMALDNALSEASKQRYRLVYKQREIEGYDGWSMDDPRQMTREDILRAQGKVEVIEQEIEHHRNELARLRAVKEELLIRIFGTSELNE